MGGNEEAVAEMLGVVLSIGRYGVLRERIADKYIP